MALWGVHPAIIFLWCSRPFSHALIPLTRVWLLGHHSHVVPSAHLIKYLCSSINGWTLAGILGTVSDHHWIQKELSLRREPPRTLHVPSQQQTPTLPALRANAVTLSG